MMLDGQGEGWEKGRGWDGTGQKQVTRFLSADTQTHKLPARLAGVV